MIDDHDRNMLRRLAGLVNDFSYPERRSPEMLAEIDALLEWALRDHVRSGMKPAEISELLGEPYGMIGEESDGSWDWTWPALPPPEVQDKRDRWFHTLRFRSGMLESVSRRRWRSGDR